jgi:hypothetical protein
MPYIGNPIYQSAFVTDQFSGTGSQTAYTMSVAPAGVTNVLVVVSGVVQDPSTYGVVGNTLTFTTAPPSGTGNISCRYLGVPVTGVTTTAYRTVTEFTATASQTTFTPPSYSVGFINVYLNGVLLGSADYTATNGTTVVLTTGASAGNLVTVESFSVSSVLNALPQSGGTVSGVLNLTSLLTLSGSAGTAGQVLTSQGSGSNPTWTYSSSYSVDYLVVAGGGGAAGDLGGGGGAGGYISSSAVVSSTSAYTVTIGAGGTGGTAARPSTGMTNGANSSLVGGTISSTAVGGGTSTGYSSATSRNGLSGGSGGGGSGYDGSPYTSTGGAGTSGQGNTGGAGSPAGYYMGGGGGGAGAVGGNAVTTSPGSGGNGTAWLNGTTYAGGGGGGGYQGGGQTASAPGGTGGGGAGGYYPTGPGGAGTTNTGGGGGGGAYGPAGPVLVTAGGAGGSGVVVIRYLGATRGSGGTITSSGGYTYHTFTTSGTYTA